MQKGRLRNLSHKPLTYAVNLILTTSVMNKNVYYLLSILQNTHSMWKTMSGVTVYSNGILFSSCAYLLYE
jgi:hypothetical protein